MRKLIRSFERARLEYLLISGQAAILYGASTFSEDVDLWIRPTAPNARRLLRGLAAVGARVDRLTPPLTERNLRAGHGFHFRIPARPSPIYLEGMGRPPRVEDFETSLRRARRIPTPWGTLPVVSPEDLIALKRTKRLSDYEVISALVEIGLSETPRPSRARLRWAVRNTYRAEVRARLLAELGTPVAVGVCRRRISAEVARWQARDAAYWKRVIGELRRWRREGALLPEGTPVSRLIRL